MGQITTDFYPDAHPESTCMDTMVGAYAANVDLTTLVAYTNNNAGNYTDNSTAVCGLIAGETTNKWSVLYRIMLLFDTSSIPNDATIDSATLSVFCDSNTRDEIGISESWNVYSANPASNTDTQTVGDFAAVGSTAFSTTKTSLTTSDYNTFTLNSSGLSAISKTGISKFSIREVTYDVGNTNPPAWGSGKVTIMNISTADSGSNKPKLSVTYTTTTTDYTEGPLKPVMIMSSIEKRSKWDWHGFDNKPIDKLMAVKNNITGYKRDSRFWRTKW